MSDTDTADSTASSDETAADAETDATGAGNTQQPLAAFDAGTDEPADACVYYAECGNIPPGNNDTCDDCLDRLRAADRQERDDR